MLGFIGSNSNMAFAITDIVVWLFKFAVKIHHVIHRILKKIFVFFDRGV